MPLCEALARPAGVEGHITCTRIASETGISRVWPPLSSGVCRVRRSASERRGAVADDARAREVGLRHSSCEAGEQSGASCCGTIRGGASRGGAGGAKDGDQGKCGPAKHVQGAAPGVDRLTWRDYEADLERNLEDLHDRVQRGAYRALPSRRVYIPKPDGRQRPLAVAALEDKIVQRAVVALLNAIYEEDFLGISYGFRPGRGTHDALDALCVGIDSKKVSWILDADIRSFFDTVSHEWLVRFVEHRIGDRRIVRLIQKWLKVGILEDGVVTASDRGTGQGSVISPLLANIYLHYVLDLWAERWRRHEATGDMIIVRYADDIVVGFEREMDARRFLDAMRERFE